MALVISLKPRSRGPTVPAGRGALCDQPYGAASGIPRKEFAPVRERPRTSLSVSGVSAQGLTLPVAVELDSEFHDTRGPPGNKRRARAGFFEISFLSLTQVKSPDRTTYQQTPY